MPQDLADFGQRGAAPQHLRRQAVAELVGALGRSLDARSLEGISDDAGDGTRSGKSAERGVRPQEHTAAGTAGSSMPEVRGNRRTDVGRYGECGPGYIPTERAWTENDSNLADWCWVNPGSEKRMLDAMERGLKKN